MSALKSYFKDQFRLKMLFLEYPKPAFFYLSGWQTTRSVVPLLICRIFLFLCSLGILISSVIIYIVAGFFKYWFIYLTHWGLMLLTLSTGFSVAVSARCYIYGPISAGAEFSLPWYLKVYWLLYNISVPVAFLITIFYWTLLYNTGLEEELNHGLDVAVHGLNSLVMFLLLITSSHPSYLLHVFQPVLFTLVYAIFGVIFYLAGGHDQNGNPWIYPVVNWAKPGTTITLMLITGLLLILLHCITVGVSKGRDALSNALVKRSPTKPVDEALPLRQPPRNL